MCRDLVSIIIPAYNSSKHIKLCIDSCLKQTYPNIEIIIVNDGSIDNTIDILEENYQIFPHIKIFTTINQGVSAARRIGAKKAKGKWIFFLDSDDTIPEYAIEQLVNKALESHSDLVIGDITYLKQDFSILKIFKNTIDVNPIKSALTFRLSCNLWGRLISSDCLQDIQWPSRDIKIGEDIICGFQLLLKSSNVTILEHSVYNYVQYPNSTINSHNPSYVKSMLLYLHTIDNYFSNDSPYRKYLDYFIVNEYFAYLMYGGKWEYFEKYKLIYKRCILSFPFKIRIAFSPIGHCAVKIARLLK